MTCASFAVTEELNFRRAAERLHVAQPMLSRQIRALEKELDAQLFLRDRDHQAAWHADRCAFPTDKQRRCSAAGT